jgi:hypothetical protein
MGKRPDGVDIIYGRHTRRLPSRPTRMVRWRDRTAAINVVGWHGRAWDSAGAMGARHKSWSDYFDSPARDIP